MKKNKIVKIIVEAFRKGNKLFIIGNGGSAAMTQHMAAELVGGYVDKSVKLPAISLAADMAVVTAIANDFGYKYVFSRQIEALAKEGDILVVLSTSGKSLNVLHAMRVGISMNMNIIDFPRLGKSVQEIQENQLKLTHIICREVKEVFVKK